MLLIVNLNLALDHVLHVDQLQPAGVHRATRSYTQAGGKGVNVARALKAFGVSAQVTGFLGGWRRATIQSSARQEKIQLAAVPIRGDSRACVILLDDRQHTSTVINEPGPVISQKEWEGWATRYQRMLARAEAVLLTGSFPPGVPPAAARQIVAWAKAAKKPVLVDTSGPALAEALKAKPTVLKINQVEAESLAGFPIKTVVDAQRAAVDFLRRGVIMPVITMGRWGAVITTRAGAYYFQALTGMGWNDIGSGDALLAGVAAGFHQELPPVEIGPLAIAAATASLTHGFGKITADEVRRLTPHIRHKRLE